MVGKEHITGRFLLVNNSNQHDLKCRCPNMYANKVHKREMIGMSAVCGKKSPHSRFLETSIWDACAGIPCSQ